MVSLPVSLRGWVPYAREAKQALALVRTRVVCGHGGAVVVAVGHAGLHLTVSLSPTQRFVERVHRTCACLWLCIPFEDGYG